MFVCALCACAKTKRQPRAGPSRINPKPPTQPHHHRPTTNATMLADGIRQIGDGLLEVAADRLQGLIAQTDINEIYEVEQTPFAR